jgi:hypothetical protein
MGPAPADLPAAPTAAVAGIATAAAVAPVATATKAAGVTAAVGKAGGDAVGGAAAAAAAAAGGGGDAGVLDWRSVSTWVKMEALLDEEDGLQGVEGAVAVWLAQLLPQCGRN